MDFYNSSDIPANLAELSFAANIARIMPQGSAPLFALSGLAKKVVAKQIEHGYWSKTMEFTQVLLDQAVTTAGQSTIGVASTNGLLPQQVLRFHRPFVAGNYVAPEMMQIQSVNHVAGTITVTRGFGGTTPFASLAVGTIGMLAFSAHEEGSTRPESRAIKPVRTLNNTHIFRNAWSQTRTLEAIKMIIGGGAVQENKRDCFAFHSTDIELAALFSRKSMSMGPQGNPLHTMNGIEALIEESAPTNLREAGATTNYTQLEDLLDPLLDQQTDFMTGNQRTIYCGKTALKVINNIGRLSGEYQLVDKQTNFGMSFRTFQTTRGRFNLVEHPLMNTNADLQKMAVVMDLSSFDFAYLEGRDTVIEQYNGNMQSTDGTDATGGVVTSELTIQLQNPFACGILYNLRQGAA